MGGKMKVERFEDVSASVEVGRFKTSTGSRIMIRDPEKNREVYLDPIELEGLARTTSESPGEEEQAEDLEVLQNEFARVEVGRVESRGEAQLLIRDSASGAEIRLSPSDLMKLTSVRHEYFGPLIDPSEMVAEAEPDPDQV
jgi:hypothetical protein